MTRAIPARPHLDSDRKRAKALKKAHAAGEAEALARIAAHHPRFRGLAPEAVAAGRFRLADAQLVVAREYGVESWPRWVALGRFLRADLAERARLFVEAAVGERPERAHDLLAHAPELAVASLEAAYAAGDAAAAARWLARDPEAATRADGPLGAPALWTLCWSGLHAGAGPVEAARAQVAKDLLRAGAEAGATAERDSSWGRHRFTALYGAVHRNRPALVKELLEAGATPDDGESLYHASEHADGRCLAHLLAHGATLSGSNALNRALDQLALGPLRALLEAGADPAERGPRGQDALHTAALRGRGRDALELLVRHGAPLAARDAAGRTAFEIATRLGHAETAAHLRELGAHAALGARDRFVGACARGGGDEARALLAGGEVALPALDPDDLAALPRAAEYGRSGAARLMLDLGFPLEAEGGDWRGTALNHAAHAGHPELVALLLERGADPERENEHGGTAFGALAWSSRNGDGNDSFRPGRSEARRQADLAACADLLAAAGARILPRHLANATPPVAEALRRHGAGDAGGG